MYLKFFHNLSPFIDLPIYGVEKITTKIGGKGVSAGLKICCENWEAL
jgi:hypothetical protein